MKITVKTDKSWDEVNLCEQRRGAEARELGPSGPGELITSGARLCEERD